MVVIVRPDGHVAVSVIARDLAEPHVDPRVSRLMQIMQTKIGDASRLRHFVVVSAPFFKSGLIRSRRVTEFDCRRRAGRVHAFYKPIEDERVQGRRRSLHGRDLVLSSVDFVCGVYLIHVDLVRAHDRRLPHVFSHRNATIFHHTIHRR